MRCVLVWLAVVGVCACGRSAEETNRIVGVPEEQSVAVPSPVPAAPPPTPSVGSPARNPLAMPLKHDGVAPRASAYSVADPCRRPAPTGPLAMALKHDGRAGSGDNPLCMRLK